MKALLSGAAVAALVAASLPAWSQTTPSNQQNAPGAGGVSKPGAAGLPGNKSGPAVRDPSGSNPSSSSAASTSSSGTTSGPASSNPGSVSTGNTQLQDQSKVPGVAGNKSGPSVREPGSATHAGGAAAGMSESEIKQAQQKLKAEGLYHGEIDGIIGPQTHNAVAEFQKKHGLKQSGHLDEETTSALLGGQATGTGSSTPPASGQAGSETKKP